MEGQQQRTGGTDGTKSWLFGFQWSWEGMSMEDAREKADQIADYAAELGLNRVSGGIVERARARSRRDVRVRLAGAVPQPARDHRPLGRGRCHRERCRSTPDRLGGVQ
jgi:hypothetical protein